jgi:hypothetical protein
LSRPWYIHVELDPEIAWYIHVELNPEIAPTRMTQIPPISPTTFTVILILLAIKNSESDAYLEIIWTIPLSSSYQGSTFLIFSLYLHFCSPTCLKAKFRRKNYIYSNKFFHNFHLSESSFTCPRLHASGLVQGLIFDSNDIFICQ